jgi:hypothetical protein
MIKFFRKIRQKLLLEGKTGKYFKYAFGEIILVVIGILLALQVNNWNTNRINKNRVSQYAKLLIEDISNDIEMIEVSQFQAIKNFNKIDSLKNYISSTVPENLSNTDLYVLTHDIMYRPYKWNRSTFAEMKSAEILQYFKNDSLKKKLIAYETFSYHLEEDFNQDITNALKAEDLMTEILDLNNPYFSQMLVLENDRFNDPELDLFQTEIYQNAKKKDRSLIIENKNDLRKFTNAFILLQDSYRIRAFHEMNEIIDNAEEIIELLKIESK